jgi:hypothetical protein
MKITSIGLLLACALTILRAQQFSVRQENAPNELAQLAGRSLRSENAVIAVQVNDTLGGTFNSSKGLFSIGTADNKPLLAIFPDEQYFSHFNVRIDGVVYSNNSNRTGALALPLSSDPQKLADGTITCSYRVGAVTIEQQLTPEQYSAATGAIRMKRGWRRDLTTAGSSVNIAPHFKLFRITFKPLKMTTPLRQGLWRKELWPAAKPYARIS